MPTGPRPAPPPGTARVAISGSLFTHHWTNVFYLELTGSSITINDLQTLATDIANAWNTDIAVEATPDVTLTSVDVRYIPTAGQELRYVLATSHVGTNAGTTIADASAAHVIDWIISDYYRGGHPRTYMPGVKAADVSNGSDVASNIQGNIATQWNAFRNALNALTTTNITGVSMGTVRFESGKAWLSPPRFVPFTSAKYGKNGKVASQRRRILS